MNCSGCLGRTGVSTTSDMQVVLCERLLLLFRVQYQAQGVKAGGWAEDRCTADPTDTDDDTAS